MAATPPNERYKSKGAAGVEFLLFVILAVAVDVVVVPVAAAVVMV